MVRLTGRLDMPMAYDWDVKPQSKCKSGSAVAQWLSALHETEGPRVRASPVSLHCALEQEH